MKQWMIRLFCLGLAAVYIVFGAAIQTEAKENQKEIAGQVLRLHIRANSDSVSDQQLKLQVREAVIDCLKTYRSEMRDIQSAKLTVAKHRAAIQGAARQAVQSANYEVNITLGRSWFPEKRYGDVVLPEGMYDAVIVNIGQAQGQNWWCVLFPQLCFIDVTHGYVSEEAKEELGENLSEDAYDSLIDPSVEARFKIVEWLQNIW